MRMFNGRFKWGAAICAMAVTAVIVHIGVSVPKTFERPGFSTLPMSSMSEKETDEGKRIVTTICVRCHFDPRTGTLSGKKHANPERIGDLWSGNITQDSVHGIGTWSRRDLVYFLRFGVTPVGRYVFDMPKYLHLSDADMSSLVSFLRSDDPLVRATPSPNPAPDYSWAMKFLMAVWLRPPDWSPHPVEHPDTNDAVAFGRYLAVAKFACFDCHSGNSMTNNHLSPEHSWRFFKGGSPHADEMGRTIHSPDLTSGGVATSWSEEEFIRCVRTGIRPDSTVVRDPMFPFVLLSQHEARAIFSYLKTL
jgi:mono/diheme cytochrome c family protein